jgi:hypothetical protein
MKRNFHLTVFAACTSLFLAACDKSAKNAGGATD